MTNLTNIVETLHKDSSTISYVACSNISKWNYQLLNLFAFNIPGDVSKWDRHWTTQNDSEATRSHFKMHW